MSTKINGNGNLTIENNRIVGDFSNATVANRVMFQTSTVNIATVVGYLPNGTSTYSYGEFYNSSNPTNASMLQIGVNGAIDATIRSGIQGSGSYLPMTFYTGGSERMRITTSGVIQDGAGIELGYKDVPSNAQAASYTLTLADRGKSIDFTGAASQTITIPANASVAFPVGATITITNNSANAVSIAITTDTLRLAGSTTTGTRTLAAYGVATARKVASTTWIISGAGLS